MKSPVGAGQKGREAMSEDDPVLECAKQMATITAAMMSQGLLVGGPVANSVVDIIRGHHAMKLDLTRAKDQLEMETLKREEADRYNRDLMRRIEEADRVIVAMAHRMLSHGAL